jgi:hypothetical protein
MPINFRDRAEGSESKLRTYRDGWRILNMILSLTRHERPMYYFGVFAVLFALMAGVLVTPAAVGYLQTGIEPHAHAFVVPGFLAMLACLTGLSGLLLDGIRKSRHEHSRLSYMRHPAVRDASYVMKPAAASVATMPSMRFSPERTHSATAAITAASVMATGI